MSFSEKKNAKFWILLFTAVLYFLHCLKIFFSFPAWLNSEDDKNDAKTSMNYQRSLIITGNLTSTQKNLN